MKIIDTPRKETVDNWHGVSVADPYQWLEDVNQTEVQRWLLAQNDNARLYLDKLPAREAIAERFEQILYLDAVSTPVKRKDRYFFTRRSKDKEKSVFVVRINDQDKILIDPNQLSADGTISLRRWYPSHDGRYVAYLLSENNADESTMYVLDVDSGENLPLDIIEGAKYAGPSWMPDSSGFYYEFLSTDPNIPVSERPGHTELRYHKLGTKADEDIVVFPATYDPQTFLYGGLSEDGQWLMVGVQRGWNQNDVYIRSTSLQLPKVTWLAQDADVSTQERVDSHAKSLGFVPLAVGFESKFDVTWYDGHFYVQTDYKAPNSRIMKVDPNQLGIADWHELVPESSASLASNAIIGGHLVLKYIENASDRVKIYSLDGQHVRDLVLPSMGSVGVTRGESDSPELFYNFTSFATPDQIYKTYIDKEVMDLWSKIDIPIDTSNIGVEQVWYTSKDGTKVSMFVVHKKDLKLDGRRPTLLYGYGGFNVSLTPYFSALASVWLEHGGVYAVANLRGGGEYGEAWHEAGMGANKQNVFDDFIAAAEYLIEQKYTSKENLGIYGGSNGGLLVAAVMTQRPDLYKAVVCAVPLLDMLRYHLFGSGKTWIAEYGSAENEDEFQTLYAYSPYHQVKEGQKYPSLLMMAADSDDRVDPMHARKFVAAVQWAIQGQDTPILLRVEANAGHGGADQIKSRVDSSTDIVSYLLDQLSPSHVQ